MSFLRHSSRLIVTNGENPRTFRSPSNKGRCRGPVPIRDLAHSPHSHCHNSHVIPSPNPSPQSSPPPHVVPPSLPVSLPSSALPGHRGPAQASPPAESFPPQTPQASRDPPLPPRSLSSHLPFAALRPCYLWTVSIWKQGWTHSWQPGLVPVPPHQPHPLITRPGRAPCPTPAPPSVPLSDSVSLDGISTICHYVLCLHHSRRTGLCLAPVCPWCLGRKVVHSRKDGQAQGWPSGVLAKCDGMPGL